MTRNLTNMDQFRTFVSVIYNGDTDITPIVESVTWSGDVMQPFRTLELTLKNTLDGINQAITIELGKEIVFYDDDKEYFRGFIFAHEIDATGNMTVTAYDENIYLTKNADDRRFANMTASAIIERLCNDFGVTIGEIADTEYVIPKLVLRNMTLIDMMTTALTVTWKQTGQRFFISSKEGAFYLVKRSAVVFPYILENGTNLTGASYRQSIEDMRTQIKVVGGDPDKNPISATVKDDDLIAKFGVIQHVETADSDKTQSEIEDMARQLLAEKGVIADEANIEALGYSECIAGVSAYVYDTMTGIIGSYYVVTDTHTYSNGVHTMSLRLSATDDLPTLEYEDPEPVARKKKGGGLDFDVDAAIGRLGN